MAISSPRKTKGTAQLAPFGDGATLRRSSTVPANAGACGAWRVWAGTSGGASGRGPLLGVDVELPAVGEQPLGLADGRVDDEVGKRPLRGLRRLAHEPISVRVDAEISPLLHTRFAYIRDPQTFAWPGSWIALAADQRSPSGRRPVLMFGDPRARCLTRSAAVENSRSCTAFSPPRSTDADFERTSPSPIVLGRRSGRSWH